MKQAVHGLVFAGPLRGWAEAGLCKVINPGAAI